MKKGDDVKLSTKQPHKELKKWLMDTFGRGKWVKETVKGKVVDKGEGRKWKVKFSHGSEHITVDVGAQSVAKYGIDDEMRADGSDDDDDDDEDSDEGSDEEEEKEEEPGESDGAAAAAGAGEEQDEEEEEEYLMLRAKSGPPWELRWKRDVSVTEDARSAAKAGPELLEFGPSGGQLSVSNLDS